MHENTIAFIQAIAAGKTQWTREELTPYLRHIVGENSETAQARTPLVAKAFADGAGLEYEHKEGARHYYFRIGTGAPVAEKPVEKKAGDEPRLDSPVVFPAAPAVAIEKLNYIEPVWFRKLSTALDAGKHVAIAGPPGGGKSTAPEIYFARRKQPFVTVNGDAGFRRRDMEGSVEVQDRRTFFRVAEFAAAAVNGWGCILNEVNAADPDALMYINGLLEVPFMVNIQGRAYPVHQDFRLIVTYNPGLVGTKPLPQAFKDRFLPIKLDFPPTPFLRKMLISKGMAPSAPYADRLLKYAADAWALHIKGNLRYQISPRRLFDVVFLMDNGVTADLNEAIKQAIVDAVDSPADAQMLTTLINFPAADIRPVSQFA